MSPEGRRAAVAWLFGVVPITAVILGWHQHFDSLALLFLLVLLMLHTTVTALIYHQEATVPRPANPSPTDAANLRKSADRLVALGVLKSWAFDREESPRTLTVRTAADDVVEVPRRDAPALLRGIGLGSWAVSR